MYSKPRSRFVCPKFVEDEENSSIKRCSNGFFNQRCSQLRIHPACSLQISISAGYFHNYREIRLTQIAVNEMCYLEDIYHSLCNHWGKPRNYAPCAAGMNFNYGSYGCHNAQKIGVANVGTKCQSCLNMVTRDKEADARLGDWNARNPLRGMGEEGRKAVARRRLEMTWGYNSKDFPWFVPAHLLPPTPWRDERRRSVSQRILYRLKLTIADYGTIEPRKLVLPLAYLNGVL